MTDNEKILLMLLEDAFAMESKAILLQSYIAEYGPLSEEAGAKVRALLVRTKR